MVTETDLELGDGRALHAYDAGTDGADDRLAVFWHHGPLNVGAPPEPLFPAAEELGIRWVSYDRPGYGGSTPRPDREVTGPLLARTGAYWLHAVSSQGLEISRALAGEEAGIFLVPWGGVLVLNGVPHGELEEEARRKFAIDRQKLLNRLGDPQEGDANLGLDARRFLGFNPHDEEVRAALGRLPKEYTYP